MVRNDIYDSGWEPEIKAAEDINGVAQAQFCRVTADRLLIHYKSLNMFGRQAEVPLHSPEQG